MNMAMLSYAQQIQLYVLVHTLFSIYKWNNFLVKFFLSLLLRLHTRSLVAFNVLDNTNILDCTHQHNVHESEKMKNQTPYTSGFIFFGFLLCFSLSKFAVGIHLCDLCVDSSGGASFTNLYFLFYIKIVCTNWKIVGVSIEMVVCCCLALHSCTEMRRETKKEKQIRFFCWLRMRTVRFWWIFISCIYICYFLSSKNIGGNMVLL